MPLCCPEFINVQLCFVNLYMFINVFITLLVSREFVRLCVWLTLVALLAILHNWNSGSGCRLGTRGASIRAGPGNQLRSIIPPLNVTLCGNDLVREGCRPDLYASVI